MKKSTLYENRELSWLKFNERVLEEAESTGNPLLERLRFVSIYNSNLDEFYRVRVGGLYDRLLIDEDAPDNKAGMKLSDQLESIFKVTAKLGPRVDAAYAAVMEGLREHGIVQLDPECLPAGDMAFLKLKFEREIAPVISPFIFEKNHPFPFFPNGQTVVGVTLKGKKDGHRYGLIPLSSNLPELVFIPGARQLRFILMEDLLRCFAHKVFHKFQVEERVAFSIIRNADIDEDEGLYDYDLDFRDTMSKLIERRNKLAPVRLKYTGSPDSRMIKLLKNVLLLSKRQLFRQTHPLRLKCLGVLEKTVAVEQRPELFYHKLTPQASPDLEHHKPYLDQIARKPLLLQYPYEDMSQLIRLLRQCSMDPRVTEIKMSLYRVARDSKVVNSLIEAAKNGKKVTCLVELRARFDEENNIDWSKRLEEAGCRVIYGPPKFKVHCKLLLITYKDEGRIKKVAQIGTGNFNETTAKIYTDLAYFTANRKITEDVEQVFEALCEERFVESAQYLLVAPLCLKTGLLELIDEEIAKAGEHKPCGILLKMNSLTDKDLIDKLIEASRAGVKIKMLIRGICCLRPGIPGETENIDVTSIVGRFLEHSRIYVFGGGSAKKVYISSADFMTRNTEQRVEAAVPILQRDLKNRLVKQLRLQLSDTVKARTLTPSGKYVRRKPKNGQPPLDSQLTLFREAYDRLALPVPEPKPPRKRKIKKQRGKDVPQ